MKRAQLINVKYHYPSLMFLGKNGYSIPLWRITRVWTVSYKDRTRMNESRIVNYLAKKFYKMVHREKREVFCFGKKSFTTRKK